VADWESAALSGGFIFIYRVIEVRKKTKEKTMTAFKKSYKQSPK